MTIGAITTETGPLTASGTTPLDFTFAAPSASEIEVVRDGLVVDPIFYAVALNANMTGTITPNVSFGSSQIYIRSKPNFLQPTGFERFAPWFPDQLNGPLDRLMAHLIWLKNTVSSLAVSVASVLATLSDPEAFRGPPGINGGTASNLTIGLFATANGQNLGAVAPEVVFTSGFSTIGKGAAVYKKSAVVDATFAAAHPGWTFRSAAGVGYMLSHEQDITFEMFGGTADFNFTTGAATDNYPAWLIAKDFLQYHAFAAGNAYYKTIPALHFGRGGYYFSDAIDLTDGVYQLFGYGPSAPDNGGNTALIFAVGKCGIICQSWDTAGVTGTTANTPKGATATHLVDLAIYSHGGTLGAEEHGLLIKSPIFVERVNCYNFGGYGFRIAADVLYAGNANCGKLRDCVAWGNGSGGLYATGGDSNAWEIYGFFAINNMGYGIHEASFLGNHFFGGHTAGNGNWGAGPYWAPYRRGSTVHYNGHWYAVAGGQSTGASTNAPSGTTANNTWWTYQGVDAGPDSRFPTWVSGTHYLEGGAMLVEGASNKAGVSFLYMESDQEQGKVWGGRSLILAGGYGFWTGGAQLNAHDGRLWTPAIGTTLDGYGGCELHQDMLMTGQECFFRRTGSETFQLRGNLDISVSMARQPSSDAHPYSMSFPKGLYNAGAYVSFAAAIPTSGAWNRGDILYNSAPTAGGKIGWVCTASGSPGTWKAFGVIDA